MVQSTYKKSYDMGGEILNNSLFTLVIQSHCYTTKIKKIPEKSLYKWTPIFM